jgi:hypothetical protein
MTRLERLRHRLHRRKANRERKRRLKQGHRARREARAVQKLRRLIRRVIRLGRGPTQMYDSTSVGEIPADAEAALGYVGGSWPTYANGELRARCPHAKLVSIAVASSYDADFLDIENGDATIADAPRWFRRQRRRGLRRPGFYISASNANSLIAYLKTHGIKLRRLRLFSHYKLLTAHYGVGRHICGPKACGLVTLGRAGGTQFTDEALGRNLDESVLRRGFLA